MSPLLKAPKIKTPHKMRSLGGGTANEVYKAEYKTGLGGLRRKAGFFKPTKQAGGTDDLGRQSSDAHIRALAASRVDQALGFNLLPKERIGKRTDKGLLGAFSPKVKGQATVENRFDKEKPTPDAETAQMYMDMFAGMYKMKDGKLYESSGQTHVAFDYSKAKTQKGLSDLQLLDAIIAQSDRHGGNIFIDKKGNVRGIDNDLAMDYTDHVSSYNAKALGLPELIDAKTAKRLLAITPDQLITKINANMPDDGKLQQGELDALKTRYTLVRTHLQNEQQAGRLIKKWDKSTYARQVGATRQAGIGSNMLPSGYLARGMQSINTPQETDELRDPSGKSIPKPPTQPVPILAQGQNAPLLNGDGDMKVPDNLPPPILNLPDIGGPPPSLPPINNIGDDLRIPLNMPPLPEIPDDYKVTDPPPPVPNRATKPSRNRPIRARPLPPIPTLDEEGKD